jgi:hypothetical protein
VILQAIARFDAKTLTIAVVKLVQCCLDSMHHVNEIANAMLIFVPFVIAANHPHLTGNTAVFGAFEGIVCRVALATFESGTGARFFTSNHRRHDKRQIEGLKPSNHRHTVEPSIQIELFDTQVQRRQHCPRDDDKCCGFGAECGCARRY